MSYTNGDKIRSLSDEELANKFMELKSNSCYGCPISNYHRICKAKCDKENKTIHRVCKEVFLAWLQSESID